MVQKGLIQFVYLLINYVFICKFNFESAKLYAKIFTAFRDSGKGIKKSESELYIYRLSENNSVILGSKSRRLKEEYF